MKIKPLKDTVVHCRTLHEATTVLTIFELNKWGWVDGVKPTNKTNYTKYKSKTCYEITNNVAFSPVSYYKDRATILTFKEFLDYCINGTKPIKPIEKEIKHKGRTYVLKESLHKEKE